MSLSDEDKRQLAEEFIDVAIDEIEYSTVREMLTSGRPDDDPPSTEDIADIIEYMLSAEIHVPQRNAAQE